MQIKIGDYVELERVSENGNASLVTYSIVQQKESVKIIGFNKHFYINNSNRTKTETSLVPANVTENELGCESPLAKLLISAHIGDTVIFNSFRYKIIHARKGGAK